MTNLSSKSKCLNRNGAFHSSTNQSISNGPLNKLPALIDAQIPYSNVTVQSDGTTVQLLRLVVLHLLFESPDLTELFTGINNSKIQITLPIGLPATVPMSY